MWEWIGQLNQSQATVIGTALGWLLGILTLVSGALFNSWLNRRRDDRLREEDRTGLASALHAELKGIYRALVENAEHLKENPPAKSGGFVVPKLTIKILPETLSKVGLLNSGDIQSVMGAFILSEQYMYKLVLFGGELQKNMPADVELVYVSTEHTDSVIALNEVTAEGVQKGIDALVGYIK